MTDIDISARFDRDGAKVRIIRQTRRPDGSWSNVSEPSEYLDENCPMIEGDNVGYGRRIVIEEA